MSTASLPFDTLAYVKRLKQADVPEKQAEAQAEALRAVLVEHATAHTETSAREVHALDTKTEQAIARLESRLDGRFARLEGRMVLLQWMLGFLVAAVSSLVLKTFF